MNQTDLRLDRRYELLGAGIKPPVEADPDAVHIGLKRLTWPAEADRLDIVTVPPVLGLDAQARRDVGLETAADEPAFKP